MAKEKGSGSSKSIIRVRKDDKYFTASNEPFNDKNLSWGARGVMGYLLSKPNNWQVRNTDLYRQSKDSKYRVDGYLKELQANGYMRRYRVSEGKGKVKWITEIYESKDMNPNFSISDISNIEKSTVENTAVEKRGDILNTESLNTDSLNNEGKEFSPNGQASFIKENPLTESDSPNDSGSPNPKVIPAASIPAKSDPAAPAPSKNGSPNGSTPESPGGSGQPPIPPKPAKNPRQKPDQDQPGPLTILRDTFVEETGTPWVFPSKKEEGYAWANLRTILKLAEDDIDRGVSLIKESVKRLKDEVGFVPGKPRSLIDTIKRIIGEQNTKAKSRLLSGLTPEQLEAYQKRQAETAKEAYRPD